MAKLASTVGLGALTLLGGGPPKPKPPPTMPDPSDPVALLAQKQKLAQKSATSGGRQSTILSAPAQNYTAPTFGG